MAGRDFHLGLSVRRLDCCVCLLQSFGVCAFAADSRSSKTVTITTLEKWFPLRGEGAHSLKLFCMYDKRFEISKTK